MLTSTQLTSTRFNQTDHDYFQKNFEVIDTNVSSLDEADTILLGEAHTCRIDRIKNCWLLNKIIDDNDSIYMEGYYNDLTITSEIFKKHYLYPIFKNVKYKTWDCQVTTIESICLQNHLYLKYLTIISQNINDNLLSDKEKIGTIETINTFYSESEIREEINQLILNNGEIKIKYSEIPSLVNQINFIASYSKNISAKELDALLNLSIFFITQILVEWSSLRIMGTNFNKRQICCSEKLRQEEGKFAGIFGKVHLKADAMNGYNCEILAKNVELLMETVKKKKYVILFPTENCEDIKYIEDFFPSDSKFDSKKINQIVKGVFLAITLGILAYTLSNDYIGLALIITSIGTVIALSKYVAPLKNSVDLFEDYAPYTLNDKILELSDQYSEKVKLIPEEIASKIDLKYLEFQKKFKNLKEIEPVNPKKNLVVNDL